MPAASEDAGRSGRSLLAGPTRSNYC